MTRRFFIFFVVLIAWHARAIESTNSFLPAIPKGYFLQSFDDCGVDGRQPHVLMKDCYFFTFSTSDTDAGEKERSAVFSYKSISAVYTNLDPKLSYVLALTYASDHVYKRVQSLKADDTVLHEPYALPMARATRVIVAVPPEVTRDGAMTLAWKIHGEVNATVSIIELWADGPSPHGLEIGSISGLPSALEGQVVDLAYNGVSGAQVSLTSTDSSRDASTTTDTNGYFTFARQSVEKQGSRVIQLSASHHGQRGQRIISTNNLFFAPVHYRPLPTKTAGLKKNSILLDGVWKLHSHTNLNWSPFQVPGQWLQQGFDIPKDQTVFVRKEFFIPKEWSGNRLVLRFDAIHAGTKYRLNGHDLGYSENLFTPVEWDITESAKIGETNQLDLEMKVATVSEQLSYSSDYAFHNLGGIDRSVRVFALPQTYVRQMRVEAGLDSNYRDGELRLNLLLENGEQLPSSISLVVRLLDPNGREVNNSIPQTRVEASGKSQSVDLFTRVAHPLQWSAEKPFLYKMILELQQGDKVLERIERQIGFRKIEIRGTQFFVNGRVVKLIGACHHEYDPLTGRANAMRHAEEDVRLMRDANLNYIRTSHYPPTQELLDAADRLGMYVGVEAPFCWVGGALDNASNLFATLTPTSAMVDYCHSHPSVVLWSIANESHFNRQFYHSTKMVKELDPTRPTTFNFDFANNPLCKITDIANWHYPPWPWTNIFGGDLRPLMFGEFFFPICHEQTDVRIDPGLRELWGHGSAEPDSPFAKEQTAQFAKPPMKPGIPPGEWSRMFHSQRVLGGAIWASHDDAFYFANGKTAGYAWHHGFWGLIDSWRRPKPEWWLARHIFSPVWLETRHVDFAPGQRTIRVPVENRYSFTDFSELNFEWHVGKKSGKAKFQLAPATRGELEFPIPAKTGAGEHLLLRVTSKSGTVINESSIQLGEAQSVPIPALAGAPQWHEEGNKIIIEGKKFSAVFDRSTGDFDPTDSRHKIAVQSFPALHLTRYDFGDLNGPNSPPYAVFPNTKTRRVEKVDVAAENSGLRITVREKFANFTGSTSWLMDENGNDTISSDYVYSGKPMDTREAGIRFLLRPECDELKWRRWSEWGVFPPEDISRTEGIARAHRDKKFGEAQWNKRPTWPWSQDETELGTADFRSVKFNIYEASLLSKDGNGLQVTANADAHFRAALAPNGVTADVLTRCPLGQVPIKSGDHLRAEFKVQLIRR
jgi:beta-galactosidase/beta-glucuronidase